jgi:putative two-component system response regulator
VVLLDISMPGLSGVETVRRIRGNAQWQGIHVIAYTAHAMEEEKRQILEAGFDDILVKPVSKANLLATFGPLKQRLTRETAP